MPKVFVSYLRVSTSRQGASGLGLEAQREAVARHVATTGAQLLEEFVEVESGRVNDRPVLAQAMAACKRAGGALVIAKLDRLGRNVAFVARLMDAGVDFLALDAPFANRLMLHILAAFAEHERAQIAERTKLALAAAKVRGVKLGVNGVRLAEVHKAKATAFAQTLAGPVREARMAGAITLQQLADDLNARGLTTREAAAWSPATVRRLVLRLPETAMG